MTKEKIVKWIIVSVLVLIIVVFSVLLYINKDKAFTNKIEIFYPDGCKEIYINAELVSDKCIEKTSDNLWDIQINSTLLK